MLIQVLWLQKLGWDDSLSSQLTQRWRCFRQDLNSVNQLSIPRKLHLKSSSLVEVHGFSDASQLAMAAVHVKSTNDLNESTDALVCAKPKVAPLKCITIPRLELSAAHLLSNLIWYVRGTLELTHGPVFLSNDSSDALISVQFHPSRWKESVRNQVSSIQELIPEGQWRFVPGKENPAGCACRGLKPSQLAHNHLWRHGHYQPATNIEANSSPNHSSSTDSHLWCGLRRRSLHSENLTRTRRQDAQGLDIRLRVLYIISRTPGGGVRLLSRRIHSQHTDGSLAEAAVCTHLYFDCGTTFIGSQEFEELTHLMILDGTHWSFNPPAAPHMGRKREAAVKSVKFYLCRTIGDKLMTLEEFTTLPTQIEAVLNLRPLCPLTEDPEDISVLTPGHFLIGEALK